MMYAISNNKQEFYRVITVIQPQTANDTMRVCGLWESKGPFQSIRRRVSVEAVAALLRQDDPTVRVVKV
jgi:hypothetical protein